jgi:AcrR family transcriptional regulator
MQAETREKLLDSALGAFSRKGFAAATIDEIAEGAGYSRGAFYSNFANKEELALALLDRQMIQDSARFAEITLAPGGTPETLVTRLREAFHVSETLSDWEVFRLEMLMLTKRNPDFAARCKTIYAQQRARVEDGIRKLFAIVGLRPPVDESMLSAMTLSLRHGAALLHEATGPVPLDQIFALLFQALTANAPAAATPAKNASKAA